MVDISEFNEQRIEEADLSSSPNELRLEADTNESLEVLDIGLDGGGSDAIATATVGEESMLTFPAEDNTDQLFEEVPLESQGMSLLGKMREMGLPAPTIKVPEGEDFVLTTDQDSASSTVLYREGPASMASARAEGGPANKDRLFVTTGEQTIDFTGTNTQNTFDDFSSRNPAQFSSFPFDEDVGSNREYDLLATAIAVTRDNASASSPDDFRIVTGEQRPLARSASFVDADLADYPDNDLSSLPYIYPGQPTFTPGDELDIEVRVTSGGSTGEVDVGVTHLFYRRGV